VIELVYARHHEWNYVCPTHHIPSRSTMSLSVSTAAEMTRWASCIALILNGHRLIWDGNGVLGGRPRGDCDEELSEAIVLII